MTQIDPSLTTLPQLPAATQQQGASSTSSHSGFTFHDFLSIINPLQHIPVVGTLYRAITGDTIGVPEKIAGDALYGGLWGAVSSVADAAFQALTGKDFGDTVLAFLTGHQDSTVKVASNTSSSDIAPVTVTPGAGVPAASDSNTALISASLAQKGVDGTLAQRAIYAYQRSMALPNPALSNMVLATQ